MGANYLMFMGCFLVSFSVQMMGSVSEVIDYETLLKMLTELEQKNTQLQKALESVRTLSVQDSMAQELHQLGLQIEKHHVLVENFANRPGVNDSQKGNDVVDDRYDEDTEQK